MCALKKNYYISAEISSQQLIQILSPPILAVLLHQNQMFGDNIYASTLHLSDGF
jgi:hypothetical protein